MEVINQGAATTSQAGENVVAESRAPYPSHGPPLAQQPSKGNISFHSPIEGHVEDITSPDYGPNAPFWDTSMGQAIASFGTRPTSSEDISPNEEERRQYQEVILHARELDNKIDSILGTPPPRSVVFPRNLDPWPVGYRSLADSMKPIEPILDRNVTPHNPGQTTNPTTSHIMYVPNPPGSSAPGNNIQFLFHQHLLMPGGNPLVLDKPLV